MLDDACLQCCDKLRGVVCDRSQSPRTQIDVMLFIYIFREIIAHIRSIYSPLKYIHLAITALSIE